MTQSINNFKVYLPAKDFEQSKRFYSALGFSMTEGWGGTADFELSGHSFRLQDFYVEDWANNFMIAVSVNDMGAWHRRIQEIESSQEFASIRFKPPEPVDASMVMHIWDPSGVLLVLIQ